jgi:hypothetical protein
LKRCDRNVLKIWDGVAKDPDHPTREYHWNLFDALRVENGMIKEHRDEAVINPPQPEGRAGN